ncbi:Rne/Rng family ribonuclease [Pseudactinotalea sp. Z1748]|uniref:Rne/Rng family ribonuclease n=1 Tax=Pseudactinotalea sp. Z1748 TaxID=3413027 RepID=UPI003C7AEB0D
MTPAEREAAEREQAAGAAGAAGAAEDGATPEADEAAAVEVTAPDTAEAGDPGGESAEDTDGEEAGEEAPAAETTDGENEGNTDRRDGAFDVFAALGVDPDAAPAETTTSATTVDVTLPERDDRPSRSRRSRRNSGAGPTSDPGPEQPAQAKQADQPERSDQPEQPDGADQTGSEAEAAGSSDDEDSPRLPATALLFQAPDPSRARRSRRAAAPAGPPVISDEPDSAPADGSEGDDQDDQDGEKAQRGSRGGGRGRGRRGGGRTDTGSTESGGGTKGTEQDGPAAGTGEDSGSQDGSDEDQDGSGDDSDQQGGGSKRRRRRRGGRGRRRGQSGGSDSQSDNSEEDETADSAASDGGPKDSGRRSKGQGKSEAASAKSDSGSDQADDDTDGDADKGNGNGGNGGGGGGEQSGSSSSRRRRRRSRGSRGSGSDDSGRDEVTALKGSTRLEAKRQRRRDGRDSQRRRSIITEAEFLARRESVKRDMVVRERDGRTQVAVLEDEVLVEHYVARKTQVSLVGNVYLGRVQNVLPSMEAAFIDIGKGRNAVLYAGEVNWDAAGLEGQPRRIEQALSSGDSVLVQVTKDPVGHKGARLTSQITLAGRYLVLVPSGAMTGISRKLPDTERNRLKKLLKEIVPDDQGVIVRTAAEGASEEELRRDVERLGKQWADIEKKVARKSLTAPTLLKGEPELSLRVVRDVFNEDFNSLTISGDEAWKTISEYVQAVAPDLSKRVYHWTDNKDLFAELRIDEQIAKALDRKVWLPSGGSLVIDDTEAMTVVDVNTGKFTGTGGTLEETVTRNNLEAAEEIVRQLRLRDIGGIIVIDFIDMVLEANRDLVLRRLVECLGRDRTRHQVAEVTSLGLVQMTRKRIGQGLLEAFSDSCEHCNGRGYQIHADPVDPDERSRRGGKGKSGRGDSAPDEQQRAQVRAALANIAAAAATAHAEQDAKEAEKTDEAGASAESGDDKSDKSDESDDDRFEKSEKSDVADESGGSDGAGQADGSGQAGEPGQPDEADQPTEADQPAEADRPTEADQPAATAELGAAEPGGYADEADKGEQAAGGSESDGVQVPEVPAAEPEAAHPTPST